MACVQDLLPALQKADITEVANQQHTYSVTQRGGRIEIGSGISVTTYGAGGVVEDLVDGSLQVNIP